jgi:hypothetical protein
VTLSNGVLSVRSRPVQPWGEDKKDWGVVNNFARSTCTRCAICSTLRRDIAANTRSSSSVKRYSKPDAFIRVFDNFDLTDIAQVDCGRKNCALSDLVHKLDENHSLKECRANCNKR